MPYVLLHSPLLAAAGTWGELPALLGPDTLTLEVTSDGEPPYAERYVEDAVRQIVGRADGPLTLVPHSGAGPLLPAVIAGLRDAGHPITAAIFLDAGLPAPGKSRLDLLAWEDAAEAEEFRERLAGGGRFPDWTADLLAGLVPDPEAVLAAVRPRGLDFFAELLPPDPLPADLPAGYVQMSPHYRKYADRAVSAGWPVAQADIGHLAALAAPQQVADLIRDARPTPAPR